MHCLYANAVVQPSVQHYSCYMARKTKYHTWCRYCHLCINAPMWREKRWLQGIIDSPSYNPFASYAHPPIVRDHANVYKIGSHIPVVTDRYPHISPSSVFENWNCNHLQKTSRILYLKTPIQSIIIIVYFCRY